MLPSLPSRAGARRRRLARRVCVFSAAAALLLVCGCKHLRPVDLTPLQMAGMDDSAIQSLRAINISTSEVAELLKAKQAGFSDDDCVLLLRLTHDRGEKFEQGDDVTGLLRAGVSEPTVIQLARLNQLRLWAGEAEAMRLAGLSDRIIIEVAQRRSAGQTVLSGASLANLKNSGMSESTLSQLVRRGISDSQADTIIRLRRRGFSDTQILRRYSASSRSN